MKTLAARITLASVVILALLASGPADATPPGENGRIAYHFYFNGDQTRAAIFTINPDGSDNRQITHPPRGVIHGRPDWSADGHWIVYVRAAIDAIHPHPGGDPNPRIWKMRPNGKHRHRVSDECGETVGCNVEDDPAWSPDGRLIAFTRGYEQDLHRGAELILMRADGTHVRRLTKHAQGHIADWEVQWSPSGDRVVFQRFSDYHRGSSAIFTLRLDGTGLRRITPWGEAQYPDWSPDGRWIVFSHGIDAPGDLWMVRPNGTDRHTINDASDIGWISGSFSPDGTMLVWSHAPTGTPDVYVMDRDGSNIVNLTHSPDWESGPDWGPTRT